jgi:hypothetical protein
MVDTIFCKFDLLNSSESNSYFERFEKLLELKTLNPYSSGIEYHKLLYGDNFEEMWNEKNSKIVTPYKEDYWMRMGYTMEESTNMVKKYKKNKSTTLDNFIIKYGKDEGYKLFDSFKEKSKQTLDKFKIRYGDSGIDRWNNYKLTKNSCSFDWALRKCNGDIEKAKILYSDRIESTKIDKDKKIIELGGEEQYNDYIKDLNERKKINFNYYLKKNNGDYLLATNEYTEILKSRRIKFGSASKISLLYFLPIVEYLNQKKIRNFVEIEESKHFFLYDKINSRSYCYDFCIMDLETKAIIEFNGIKWHPRLDKYSINEYKGISVYLKTDKKIREAHEYDMEKKRIAEDNGFSYLVIWDSDPADVNINLIEEFLNKNKIKYKYNENDKNKIIKKARPRKTNVGS